MTTEDRPGRESDSVIERGEAYQHDERGRVEVTGIWQGAHRVDSIRRETETGVTIVRYSTGRCGEASELTDTLEEFLEAVK